MTSARVLRIPEQVINDVARTVARRLAPVVFLKAISRHEVLAAEDLVHQRPHEVDVLVADLNEDRSALGQQILGDGEAVAQVGQVGVDAVAPTCRGTP